MKRRLLLFCLFCLLQLVFLSGSQAAIILRYDFTGALGNQASQSPSFVDPNGSATSIVRGAGLTASAGVNSINSFGFTSGAVDLTDFYGFSIATDAGQQLTVSNLSFRERRSATGIRNFEIRSSTDGFATFNSQFVGTVPDDVLFRDQSIALLGLVNLQGTVDFRIYGYAAEASTGTWRLVNHTVTGGLTLDGVFSPAIAVPEPSSFALLGLICGVGACRARRRRTKDAKVESTQA